jgi:DinB superfamily
MNCPEEASVDPATLVHALLNEAYEKKTWHGPNLKQSLKGVSARQAAWRPGPGRHNIWEVALHAAYWKYAVRRRIEGGKRGSFVLQGSNFFARPEKGKATEAAWSADKKLLEREHRAMCGAIAKALRAQRGAKFLRQFYGVAFHDIYHAGQIRLLRRLQER